MGMTAPALYRYVDSVAALEEAVAASIFDDVIAAMTTAASCYRDGDPAAELVASAAAFRGWALTHIHEFVTVFGRPAAPGAPERKKGSPLATVLTKSEGPCQRSPGERFGAYFAGVFTRLWAARPFPVPSRDQLDPSFLQLHQGMTGHPDALGMLWVFEMAWARLYGLVALEVFGHIPRPLITSGAVFTAHMLDIGQSVGLGDEWERLRPIALAATASTR